jgi:hypothetical protein
MRRAPYPYETDAERLQALSSRVRLKRLEDVISSEGYVLHNSVWWRVSGPSGPAEVGLEIAGPEDPLHPRTSTLLGSPDDLLVSVDRESGLQFREGVLLDVPWPDGGLIYVADARCRGIGDDPAERVHGIFALRFDADGDSYYAPVDPALQPGVSTSWLLYPPRDLILDWSPVDVANLLARTEAAHA